MLQWAGIGPDLLPWIGDNTPNKWGLMTPGSAIPIVTPEEMKKRKPEVLLLLAPNWVRDCLADPTITAGIVTPDGTTWR